MFIALSWADLRLGFLIWHAEIWAWKQPGKSCATTRPCQNMYFVLCILSKCPHMSRSNCRYKLGGIWNELNIEYQIMTEVTTRTTPIFTLSFVMTFSICDSYISLGKELVALVFSINVGTRSKQNPGPPPPIATTIISFFNELFKADIFVNKAWNFLTETKILFSILDTDNNIYF